MKTPEEIKKGLECCLEEHACTRCPYDDCDEGWHCVVDRNTDALAYIQRLEDHIRDLTKMVPKWISVGNPPQKEGEYIVIVQTTDGKKERMWDIFHPYHGWCEDVEGSKVLYWMSFDSLPEPPKE